MKQKTHAHNEQNKTVDTILMYFPNQMEITCCFYILQSLALSLFLIYYLNFKINPATATTENFFETTSDIEDEMHCVFK